jgi:uncharacterized NAD(P)/FAD-binding protein YdhS
LTMLDIALQLAPGRTAPIVAISRRGLVPQPHRELHVAAADGPPPPGVLGCAPSVTAYMRVIRAHVAEQAEAGIDWRDALASLRSITPRLWSALPNHEKARFLRHVRPYWDSHRHRVARKLYQRYESLRNSGGLLIMAARLNALVDDGHSMHATICPRGAARGARHTFARVINCTGPDGDVRALADPLVTQLLSDGLARTDALGLGFDVDDDMALIARDGRRSDVISVLGPMLKGRWWEATAVPELREHAARLARRLHEVCSLCATAHVDGCDDRQGRDTRGDCGQSAA